MDNTSYGEDVKKYGKLKLGWFSMAELKFVYVLWFLWDASLGLFILWTNEYRKRRERNGLDEEERGTCQFHDLRQCGRWRIGIHLKSDELMKFWLAVLWMHRKITRHNTQNHRNSSPQWVSIVFVEILSNIWWVWRLNQITIAVGNPTQ